MADGEVKVLGYFCSVCDAKVEVEAVKNAEPIIKWPCGHTGHKVIAKLAGTLRRIKPPGPGQL